MVSVLSPTSWPREFREARLLDRYGQVASLPFTAGEIGTPLACEIGTRAGDVSFVV